MDGQVENARVKKNRSRWEKADLCNYFNEEVKENTQEGQRWGAGEIDRGGDGNPWVERNIRKPEMVQKERDQERKTMDKYILCYCIFNLQKLVHQVPRSGRVYLLVTFCLSYCYYRTLQECIVSDLTLCLLYIYLFFTLAVNLLYCIPSHQVVM